MQDRVPLYPGRVKLTPVSGQNDTYDMTMADQPTVEGTPLNKETLLNNNAAAAVWPSTEERPEDPTVSDALEKLGPLLYVKEIETITYSGTKANNWQLTFSAPPKVLFFSFSSRPASGVGFGDDRAFGFWVSPSDRIYCVSKDSSLEFDPISVSGNTAIFNYYMTFNDRNYDYQCVAFLDV